MQLQVDELRPHLQAFDFQKLLVEGLGWDYYHAQPVSVGVDGHDYPLEPVAEKANFAVYVCGPDTAGSVPPYPVRRKIERQVAKLAFEHLIIFVDSGKTLQIWQWVKREAGKPAACREQEYRADQTGAPILQRLQTIAFALEEEEGLSILQVASRVSQAMDVERVTKRFYERFRTELTAFQGFIDGITAQGDREWYASLMLNRMMFVYFVQKKNFLDGDPDYLRNRLRMVQNKRGGGRFQQFYRDFLLKLFHKGLGQRESERSQELAELLGQVPFLNGGLFDVHDLERDNPDISIPDAAFERVFDFFDGYRWHLDERPRREDNEINPDVLGYIFEKYVNQKQMGAYYTKEDITGYITRNTVIPFLFDAAKEECPVAFDPGGGVWRLLQDDPDRYIYPAVGHGMAWAYSPDADPVRLEQPLELPEAIAAGLDDVSSRGGWNRPAPKEYALPTETWREVVARRQRYREVRDKLAAGQVSDVNDLITLNLDAEQFALDVIVQSEGPELLRAFWHALRDVSVLDPTCGSGAFLFAALNILEPLYTACLEGMRGFLDDLERTQRPRHRQTMSDFRDILKQADRDILKQTDQRRSHRYYILKSIVLNNLYGVDIMEEAVEICKLRLFLKLVAQLESYDQIEPLPDIDFNIKAGNTLVGFTSLDAVRQAMTITDTSDRPMPEVRRAVRGQQIRALDQEQQKTLERIDEEAEIASRAFDQFREQQTALGGEVTAGDKAALRSRLDSLREELDRYLAAEYGVAVKDSKSYYRWQSSHQPFHWFVEFYGIMSKGGFDVVVGNPPYVEYSKIRKEYQIRGFSTERCGNLYAYVIERSDNMMRRGGRFGMIVQLSYSCTDRMQPIQDLTLTQSDNVWFSHFDDRPARLFDGLEHIRATIVVSEKKEVKAARSSYSSSYNRWRSDARGQLFYSLSFDDIPTDVRIPGGAIPKIGTRPAASVLRRIARCSGIGDNLSSNGSGVVYFHNAPQYWVRAMDFTPYFWNERDGKQVSTQVKTLKAKRRADGPVMVAALNSSVFYWWFLLLSDCRHLNLREIENFPIGLNEMSQGTKTRLTKLTEKLMSSFKQHSQRKETRYQATGRVVYDEFDQKPSKPIVDEIDRALAEHYGLTEEELDFIINYDIKYRMGRDGLDGD